MLIAQNSITLPTKTYVSANPNLNRVSLVPIRDKYLNWLITNKYKCSIKKITGLDRCCKIYLLFNIFTYNLLSNGATNSHIIGVDLDWRFKLLDRTQDAVSTAGVVAESSKNPDLHVQQKRGKGNIDYYLECKYRSRWNDGAVTFDDRQLDRYRQFQRDNRRKVVFALGVGGTPSAPATLMLVPLDSVKGNTIKQIDTEFTIEASSSALVKYMNNYFSKVFSKAKQKTKWPTTTI